MAKDNTIRFFDLTMAHGATTSPFVWATKFALKHKGFDLDVVPGGFTGILERTEGNSERVPVIVDDGKWVLDSWGIVEYLDETYPDRPLLIPHKSVAATTRALDAWFWRVATGPWMRCFCADYRDVAFDHDQDYITKSREVMVGMKLEDKQKGREDRLPLISAELEPLRMALRDFQWLGGYGGLGRHPGLSNIFGLEQRPGDPDLFNRNPVANGLTKRNTGVASTSAESARMQGKAQA